MRTSALRSPPRCRSTSATREVPGSAAATKTPTARSASTSREEPTSRASPKRISMRLPCDSINVRERPWASKLRPINYKRCCTDRLNSHPESGPANRAGMSARPSAARTKGRLRARSGPEVGASLDLGATVRPPHVARKRGSSMSMSIKGYARLRGVDPKAIRRAIATGVITVDGNGKLDVAQADRAWASTRRASRMGRYQHSDAGTRSARSKIVVALAKLRLAKQRYETMRELYVDREAALELAAKEAD